MIDPNKGRSVERCWDRLYDRHAFSPETVAVRATSMTVFRQHIQIVIYGWGFVMMMATYWVV